MNNFDQSFNPSWQSTQYGWNAGYQTPFSTNIVYVTSPEEALMKTVQRNCEVVYFHQDRSEFYRVRVDNDGKKMWQAFNYASPNPEASAPVFKSDIAGILDRLKSVEDKINSLYKTEVNHAESNG